MSSTQELITSVYEKDIAHLLQTCDVPEQRRDITRADNVRWLCRNLLVRNGNNKDAVQAIPLLRRLLSIKSNQSAY